MIKTLQKMGIEGIYFNIVKAIYDKPTANIILSGEKQSIPSKIRNKTRMSTVTTIIQHILEVLATAIREEKERKGMQIGKEEVKLSLFANDMIWYIENPKDNMTKLLELISKLTRLQDTKSIHRSHLHFYILTIKNQREKLKNQSHSPL